MTRRLRLLLVLLLLLSIPTSAHPGGLDAIQSILRKYRSLPGVSPLPPSQAV